MSQAMYNIWFWFVDLGHVLEWCGWRRQHQSREVYWEHAETRARSVAEGDVGGTPASLLPRRRRQQWRNDQQRRVPAILRRTSLPFPTTLHVTSQQCAPIWVLVFLCFRSWVLIRLLLQNRSTPLMKTKMASCRSRNLCKYKKVVRSLNCFKTCIRRRTHAVHVHLNLSVCIRRARIREHFEFTFSSKYSYSVWSILSLFLKTCRFGLLFGRQERVEAVATVLGTSHLMTSFWRGISGSKNSTGYFRCCGRNVQ